MEVIRKRFLSRSEASLLFTACAFPLHTWALLIYFHQLPNYLLRMSLFDALAILPYPLVMALLDSLLVFGFLAFTCIALPNRFFKDHCVAHGAIYFFTTFVWVIPVHYQDKILALLDWEMHVYHYWVIVWVVSYLITISSASWLIRRSPQLETAMITFCDRLTILTTIYLCTDFLSLVIVMLQNLT